jgi:hypothetical protein
MAKIWSATASDIWIILGTSTGKLDLAGRFRGYRSGPVELFKSVGFHYFSAGFFINFGTLKVFILPVFINFHGFNDQQI